MITVITPTHNHAAFLPGAVQSVHGQTRGDWEHLVIDDGSSDDTPRVLAALRREGAGRLRTFRSAHRGNSAALNLGLARARGDLVAFLDADDEYLPDHLALMLETLGGRDFALGRFTLVNCSDDPDPVVPDFYRPGEEIPVRHIESCTGLLFGRRACFLDLGGFRPVRSSDTDLFNRLRAAGRTWNRAGRPSYLYFYGRVDDHLASRELEEDRQERR